MSQIFTMCEQRDPWKSISGVEYQPIIKMQTHLKIHLNWCSRCHWKWPTFHIRRIIVKCIHYDKIDYSYSYYICILQASPRASPTGPPRSRHSSVRPTVKPPPIPAYAAHKQSLQHSESPQPSPSAPSKTRPLPPNRPPPPCPITKPFQPGEVSVFLSKCTSRSVMQCNIT